MSEDAKAKVSKKAQGFSCSSGESAISSGVGGGEWGREVARNHLGEQ